MSREAELFLTLYQILDWFKFKTFKDNRINVHVNQKFKFVFKKVENI